MTPDEQSRVLTRLRAGYDKRISDDTYVVWCEELAPLDFSPAWGAVCALIRDAKFMPSIAEFLDAYRTHRGRQAPHVDKVPCRQCDGSGWPVVDGARNEVIPCSSCRTDQFEMWNRGEVPPTKTPRTTGLYAPLTEHDRPDASPETIARLRGLRDQLTTRRGAE